MFKKMEGKQEILDSGALSLRPAGGELISFSGSTVGPPPATAAPPPPAETAAAPPPPPAAGQVGMVTPGSDGFKKKRGRPRKYGPDGKPAGALSPMPISSSIPLAGEYSGWKHSQRKLVSSIKKKHKLDFGTSVGGERVACSVGANFTPHIITVGSGEDVNMKIISFAQEGSKAICILAANGSISNVTLNSCGGTLTYEGRFEILSLSGAFVPNDIGGAKGRSGGMSVSLAGPDGRVLGGGLAGMLVAASRVQVVVGSFLHGHQQEQQKLKKSRFSPATPIFTEATERAYGDEPKLSYTPTVLTHGSRSLDIENSGSLHGSDSKDLNTPHCEVSC